MCDVGHWLRPASVPATGQCRARVLLSLQTHLEEQAATSFKICTIPDVLRHKMVLKRQLQSVGGHRSTFTIPTARIL